MILFSDKFFYINTPFYSAGNKYGWGKDNWGIGLNKKRIDKLAKQDITIYVSYGKKDQLYTIKASKVKTYPVEELKWGNTKVYIIPKSALNYCELVKEEIEEKELIKAGLL